MEYYQRAKRHAKDSIDYRKLYNNIGALYYETGRYSQSIEYFEKALSYLNERELDTNDKVPNIYSNLASAYADCGKMEKAMSLFDEALKRSRAIFGENHKQTAYVYHQMGPMYKDLGDNDKALECTKKAVEIAEGLPGDNSELLVSSYNNLGNLYGRFKDYEQAKSYMEKSLELKIIIYAGEHPDIAVSYLNIGVLYYRMGNVDQAIEQYYKAERQLQANDSVHFHLIDVYINLGSAFDEKGEKEKALQAFEKGEKVVEQVCDDDDQDAYLFLPYIYDMLAQLADSSDHYKQRFIHFLDDKAILAVVQEGVGSPAEKAGMKGKYYVLKYNDWNINSPIMFFNYIGKVSEQPKDVVFMQGEEVVKQHFEKKVGVNFIIRYVSDDQQQKLRDVFLKSK